MKAIVIAADERRSLIWGEVETPRVGPRDVLLRVRAAGVNRADLLQRRGRYAPPPGESPILGLEAAGELVAVGERVNGWSVGDRVCALLAGWGCAEYACVPAELLLRVPDNLSLVEAAALPEALYTAYLNLQIEAELRAGEWVLIHAGASGVGTMAIQLARALGAQVIATASSAKLERLRELGAQVLVDRQAEDFVAVSLRATAGQGADVILDVVGAQYFERNLEALAVGGRLVVIGLLGGARTTLRLDQLLMRRLAVIGSVLRSRTRQDKAELTRQLEQRIWPLFGHGQLKPVIAATMPIAHCERAHALLEANQTIGKVVLELP